MSTGKISLLLCASMAAGANASAQEAFVAEFRLPVRGASVEAFAWRDGGDILVARETLAALSIDPPPGDARVPLSSIAGLSYVEDPAHAGVILTCTAACYATQRVGALAPAAPITESPWGGYLNYDLAATWVSDERLRFGGVMSATMFGPLGRIESSWLSDGRLARLETRWTLDYPEARLRFEVGDVTTLGVDGAPRRLGGVWLGRRFDLAPHEVTHPTPLLLGEAESASTVELYIDGVLRARERIEAGPFAIDETPFVTGAGQAQVVVTDALGRQQTITRPFFVSADLLRPGLTDWSIALGAAREGFGRESFGYGRAVAIGRYRAGVANAMTLESVVEVGGHGGGGEIGVVFAMPHLGQLRLARAETADGGAASLAWFRDGRTWSMGAQAEIRDAGFATISGAHDLRRSAAATLNLELGDGGGIAFTAAAAAYGEGPPARTLTVGYTPEWVDGASINFRLTYAQREHAELSFAVGFRLPLAGGASSTYSARWDRDGAVYRAGAQRSAPAYGGFGWRARASGGAQARFDLAANTSNASGETSAQLVRDQGSVAARVMHAGAIGWIDGRGFTGAPVRGAFALVDAGANGVAVTRDNLQAGRTGADGRVLVANLRPYEANAIGIVADDLPLDRTPGHTQIRVTPREGAGVVVHFAQAEQRMQESRARHADGAPARRGAILVRPRDGARFPIGSDGRVVIIGAEEGDVLALADDARCVAPAGPERVAAGLVLSC